MELILLYWRQTRCMFTGDYYLTSVSTLFIKCSIYMSIDRVQVYTYRECDPNDTNWWLNISHLVNIDQLCNFPRIPPTRYHYLGLLHGRYRKYLKLEIPLIVSQGKFGIFTFPLVFSRPQIPLNIGRIQKNAVPPQEIFQKFLFPPTVLGGEDTKLGGTLDFQTNWVMRNKVGGGRGS